MEAESCKLLNTNAQWRSVVCSGETTLWNAHIIVINVFNLGSLSGGLGLLSFPIILPV